MYISKIEQKSDIWVLEGKIEQELEADLFLRGECSGIPYVLELDNYISKCNDKIILSIPVSVFEQITIGGNILFTLCHNPNIKKVIEIDPSVINYRSKISVSGNYIYELIVDTKEVIISINKVANQFEVKCLEIENHAILVDIGEREELIQYTASLYLKCRYTELLWQHYDQEIFIGDFSKSGLMVADIPYEKLVFNREYQYCDLVIKLNYKNTCAEYYLKCTDELPIKSVLASDSKKDNNYTRRISVYLSGGKNIAVKSWKENNFKIRLLELIFNNGEVHMKLDKVNENFVLPDTIQKIIIQKRTYNNELKYCYSWEKKILTDGDNYVFIENLEKLLKDGVKRGDEIWDIYVSVEDQLIPIECAKTFKTNYVDAAGGYKICFYANANGTLSIYTHEGTFSDYPKTNIAVLGTCFSRSVFKSETYFNPDYKRFYNCVYTQFHSSLISLTSKPLTDYSWKDNWDKEAIRYMPTEVNKDFFERLKKSSAEYLIIDNYVDATRPIIEIGDGTFITYNKYLINSNMLREFSKCRFINPGTSEYLMLYEKHARIFISEVKKILPENHIFLLNGRFSLMKIDEKTGKKEEWEGKSYIQRNNIRWDNVDNILLSIAPEIRVIEMRNTKYVSDVHSPIPGGASPSHYQRQYYKEILEKINKFILEDKIRNN